MTTSIPTCPCPAFAKVFGIADIKTAGLHYSIDDVVRVELNGHLFAISQDALQKLLAELQAHASDGEGKE